MHTHSSHSSHSPPPYLYSSFFLSFILPHSYGFSQWAQSRAATYYSLLCRESEKEIESAIERERAQVISLKCSAAVRSYPLLMVLFRLGFFAKTHPVYWVQCLKTALWGKSTLQPLCSPARTLRDILGSVSTTGLTDGNLVSTQTCRTKLPIPQSLNGVLNDCHLNSTLTPGKFGPWSLHNGLWTFILKWQ